MAHVRHFMQEYEKMTICKNIELTCFSEPSICYARTYLCIVLGIITHSIENEHVSGTLNAVAPDYVTNLEFTKSFAAAMWRPAFIPVPAFILNLVYGEERAKAMLEGQKVIPKRTIESGYNFIYSDIDSACKECSNFYGLFKKMVRENISIERSGPR